MPSSLLGLGTNKTAQAILPDVALRKHHDSQSLTDIKTLRMKNKLPAVSIACLQQMNTDLNCTVDVPELSFHLSILKSMINGFIGLEKIMPRSILNYFENQPAASQLFGRLLSIGPQHLIDNLAENLIQKALDSKDSKLVYWLTTIKKFNHVLRGHVRRLLTHAIMMEETRLLRQILKITQLNIDELIFWYRGGRDDNYRPSAGEEVSRKSYSIIELAGCVGNLEVVKVLCDAGANVNVSGVTHQKRLPSQSLPPTGALSFYLEERSEAWKYRLARHLKDGPREHRVQREFVSLLLSYDAVVRIDHLLEFFRTPEPQAEVFIILYKQILKLGHEYIACNGQKVFSGVVLVFGEEFAVGFLSQFLQDCIFCGCAGQHSGIFEDAALQAVMKKSNLVFGLLFPFVRNPIPHLGASIRSRNRAVTDIILSQQPDLRARPYFIGYECGILRAVTPLVEAILANDAELITYLENHGALHDLELDENFELFLTAALEVKNCEYAWKLLQSHPSPKPQHLSYAMILAIETGNTKLFDLLLDAGGDVTHQIEIPDPDESGEVLYYAGVGFAPEVFDDGLDMEADSIRIFRPFLVERAGQKDDTLVILPILSAFKTKNHYLARRAMAAAPSVFEKIQLVFEEALSWRSFEFLEDFRSSFPSFRWSPQLDDYPSEWHYLIGKEDVDMMKYLVHSGIMTPDLLNHFLKAAVTEGSAAMVQNLIELGANPLSVFSSGALNELDKSRRIEIASLLLESAKNKNATDFLSRDIETLLYNPELSSSLIDSILEFGLLDLGTPNSPQRAFSKFPQRHCLNRSPLLAAISRRSYDTVEKLLVAGIDPNHKTEKRLWETRTQHTGLLTAVETEDKRLVELLIKYGADVNQPAEFGIVRTPLQMAAEKGSMNMLKLLLSHRANVNGKPSYKGGGTAFQLAAIFGDCHIAGELLNHGADIDMEPSVINGRWPLEGAAEHGRIEMVEYLWLLKEGNFPEKQSRKARDLAQAQGHFSCARWIATRAGIDPPSNNPQPEHPLKCPSILARYTMSQTEKQNEAGEEEEEEE